MHDVPHFDRHAPQFLDRLAGVVSDAVKNKEALANHARKVPTKQCPICRKMFDIQMVQNIAEPRSHPCGSCLRQLTEGFTAVTSPDGKQHAWLRGLPEEFQGKVINCNAEDWEKFASRAVKNDELPSKD